MTFVEDDYLSELGAFGVDPGDRFRMEWGAYLKARAELTVMENVNLITTADFLLLIAINSEISMSIGMY